MGDCSTHVIFYQAYWHLVYQDDDEPEWRSTSDFNIICKIGEEEKSYKLEDIK